MNSDDTVDVTYVDFGNSERLPFADIRKLPDMFLRLAKQVRVLITAKNQAWRRYALTCSPVLEFLVCTKDRRKGKCSYFVSAWDSKSSGLGSSPGRGHCNALLWTEFLRRRVLGWKAVQFKRTFVIVQLLLKMIYCFYFTSDLKRNWRECHVA